MATVCAPLYKCHTKICKFMRQVFFVILVSISLQVFSEEKTMPILQVPTEESFLAFTTGTDVNGWSDCDYSLFNSMTVYNDKGMLGRYSTSHGKYISFSFVGGTNSNNVNAGQGFWCEAKQMAFYSNWNSNQLSAFVLENDNIHLVDLKTDNILTTFPLVQISSYYPEVTIMVFSGRLSSTAIHRIVINSWGAVTIYESLSSSSRISATTSGSTTPARTFDIKGQQREDTESGLNIVVSDDGTAKKVIVK